MQKNAAQQLENIDLFIFLRTKENVAKQTLCVSAFIPLPMATSEQSHHPRFLSYMFFIFPKPFKRERDWDKRKCTIHSYEGIYW